MFTLLGGQRDRCLLRYRWSDIVGVCTHSYMWISEDFTQCLLNFTNNVVFQAPLTFPENWDNWKILFSWFNNYSWFNFRLYFNILETEIVVNVIALNWQNKEYCCHKKMGLFPFPMESILCIHCWCRSWLSNNAQERTYMGSFNTLYFRQACTLLCDRGKGSHLLSNITWKNKLKLLLPQRMTY